MLSLSAGTPPPPSIDDRRLLTLDELEAMHGLDSDPGPDQIPGLPSRIPWGRLALVAATCALVGFTIALLAAQAGVDATGIWTAITGWFG